MELLSRQPFNFNISTFSKKLMNILSSSTLTEKKIKVLIAVIRTVKLKQLYLRWNSLEM